MQCKIIEPEMMKVGRYVSGLDVVLKDNVEVHQLTTSEENFMMSII